MSDTAEVWLVDSCDFMKIAQRRLRATIQDMQNNLVPIFKDLDEDQIVSMASFRTYPRNTLIVRAGSKNTHVYIVESGELRVIDEQGQELRTLEAGDIVGERALISKSEQHTATVEVTSDIAELWTIDKASLKAVWKPGMSEQMEVRSLYGGNRETRPALSSFDSRTSGFGACKRGSMMSTAIGQALRGGHHEGPLARSMAQQSRTMSTQPESSLSSSMSSLPRYQSLAAA